MWAARLIEEHFDTLFYLNGEPATINRWLQALPDDLIRSRPRLLLAQSVMAAMRGDLETMEPLIAAAEQASVGAIVEPFTPTASRAGSLLVNVPALISLNRSYAATTSRRRGRYGRTHVAALWLKSVKAKIR